VITSILIHLTGLMAVAFAVGVILCRHPMHSALCLIGLMGMLGAIFAMMGVYVVALFQVMIYVGAVMVLMVYVIMLMDERDRAMVRKYTRYAIPATGVGLLLAVLASRLPHPSAGIPGAPRDLFLFKAFSQAFVEDYGFPIALAAVLLLVGIFSAVAVIRQQESEGRDGQR
jgi:NADH-quinone oxidoreductase subunit J